VKGPLVIPPPTLRFLDLPPGSSSMLVNLAPRFFFPYLAHEIATDHPGQSRGKACFELEATP